MQEKLLPVAVACVIVFAFGPVASGQVTGKSMVPKPSPLMPPSKSASVQHFRGYIGGSQSNNIHQVRLIAGKNYLIRMKKHGSGSLDPVLRLSNETGNVLAYNDDSGTGELDAAIFFTPSHTGNYRIVATGYGKTTGLYSLTVEAR